VARLVVQEKPYQRFSLRPTGFAPGLTVALHLPVSGRRISELRGLIDTGAEITWIYPRDLVIDPSAEVDRDPETGYILVGLEIEGHTYYVQCGYQDHPYAGSEQLLLGMNLLSNWLVTLNGRRRVLSVTHLDLEE